MILASVHSIRVRYATTECNSVIEQVEVIALTIARYILGKHFPHTLSLYLHIPSTLLDSAFEL